MTGRNKPLAESRNPEAGYSREGPTGGPPKKRHSMAKNESEPSKEIQGGTAAAQTSGTQLGSRSADAMDPAERGGMARTEGRTDSEGGLGGAARATSQERSRGGQMGRGGSGDAGTKGR